MLLDGINHIGMITDDPDRLVQFYEEVFDAKMSTRIPIGPDGSLTMIDIGPRTELNVFHNPPEGGNPTRGSMFGHGPIDHFGLQAASKDAFDEIRRRLMARGATDGFVTDFGRALSCWFKDPDGLEGEVLLFVANDAEVHPPGTPAAGYEVGVP
jgi:catechol 2,3-dioxygenase-like lactoylglutathione lyase family enzyme